MRSKPQQGSVPPKGAASDVSCTPSNPSALNRHKRAEPSEPSQIVLLGKSTRVSRFRKTRSFGASPEPSFSKLEFIESDMARGHANLAQHPRAGFNHHRWTTEVK